MHPAGGRVVNEGVFYLLGRKNAVGDDAPIGSHRDGDQIGTRRLGHPRLGGRTESHRTDRHRRASVKDLFANGVSTLASQFLACARAAHIIACTGHHRGIADFVGFIPQLPGWREFRTCIKRQCHRRHFNLDLATRGQDGRKDLLVDGFRHIEDDRVRSQERILLFLFGLEVFAVPVERPGIGSTESRNGHPQHHGRGDVFIDCCEDFEWIQRPNLLIIGLLPNTSFGIVDEQVGTQLLARGFGIIGAVVDDTRVPEESRCRIGIARHDTANLNLAGPGYNLTTGEGFRHHDRVPVSPDGAGAVLAAHEAPGEWVVVQRFFFLAIVAGGERGDVNIQFGRNRRLRNRRSERKRRGCGRSKRCPPRLKHGEELADRHVTNRLVQVGSGRLRRTGSGGFLRGQDLIRRNRHNDRKQRDQQNDSQKRVFTHGFTSLRFLRFGTLFHMSHPAAFPARAPWPGTRLASEPRLREFERCHRSVTT